MHQEGNRLGVPPSSRKSATSSCPGSYWSYAHRRRRRNLGDAISVMLCCCPSNTIHVVTKSLTPTSLLPCEAFVEQGEYFRNIKLDVFEIEIVLPVLLHLQQVIKLEIQLQQATSTS